MKIKSRMNDTVYSRALEYTKKHPEEFRDYIYGIANRFIFHEYKMRSILATLVVTVNFSKASYYSVLSMVPFVMLTMIPPIIEFKLFNSLIPKRFSFPSKLNLPPYPIL